MAMKPQKIDGKEILEAVDSGNCFIEVGNRRFMLFEVEEVNSEETYNVTEEEEARLLIEALEGYNPVLPDEIIAEMLQDKNKK